MSQAKDRAIQAREIVAADPGIPLGLLIYRLAGDRTPSNRERMGLYQVVNKLLLSGWLRDVSEGEEGQRPVSRRIYLAVPFCGCGDSLYTGSRCPDESTQTSWPDLGISECPARKRVGIDHA